MASGNTPSGTQTSNPAPTPPGAVPVYEVPAPGSDKLKRIDYIVIYGHSNLFYWWPVWVMCFVLAGWTYMDGERMIVVPNDTASVEKTQVAGYAEPRDILVAPPGKSFDDNPADGKLGMTASHTNSLGVIFAFTLFIVALVSTLTLRGLVSLVAIIGMIVIVLTLALMDWWDDVFAFLGGLDIRMNAAGYLFIGIPLVIAWALVTFIYDRAHYMIFDEGQIRYVREVGESEIVMASEGAVVEKKRDDVFRHWLLGFGSGDIQVRTGGAHGQTIELANVLNIGRKLVVINDMLQHKAVAHSES